MKRWKFHHTNNPTDSAFGQEWAPTDEEISPEDASLNELIWAAVHGKDKSAARELIRRGHHDRLYYRIAQIPVPREICTWYEKCEAVSPIFESLYGKYSQRNEMHYEKFNELMKQWENYEI